MKTLFTIAALLATASPALAATDVTAKTVATADLDLRTPKGIARLEARIAAAARAVCPRATARTVDQQARRACRAEALEGSREAVRMAIGRASRQQALAVTAGLRPGA